MLIFGLILTWALCSAMAVSLFVDYRYLEAWIFTAFAYFITLSFGMVITL